MPRLLQEGVGAVAMQQGYLALVYLRVSTEEQTKTDYDPDGAVHESPA